jgi:purine-nucleoside phosphorylase
MATAHIKADNGQIAKTILLPGDPLRAKYIADNFLENVTQFNAVRNMFGYTGTYKGKEISVMGTGMGIPSIGIYSHELITQYGVENLIRIGSCGSYQEDVKIRDVVVVAGASTNSNFASQFDLPGTFSAIPDFGLLENAVSTARNAGKQVHVGNVLSSDIFYNDTPDVWKKWADLGVLGVEMEAFGLYMTATSLKAKALCLLTVSDSLVTHEATSADERETSFNDMVQIALDSTL